MSTINRFASVATVEAGNLSAGLVIRHDQRDLLVVRTHVHRRLGEVMLELADPATNGFTTVFLPAEAPVAAVGTGMVPAPTDDAGEGVWMGNPETAGQGATQGAGGGARPAPDAA
jgi:hypothetical protein